MRKARLQKAVTLLSVLLALASAHAQVKPGDQIERANADQVKDLLSPGMYWCYIAELIASGR